MSLQISGNNVPKENPYSKVADAKSNTDKAKLANQKPAPTKPKADTIQLSKTAQTNAATPTATAEQVQQLQAEGKTAAQIAASLGISIATVESYLGASATAPTSNANSAAATKATAPVATSVTSASKTATIA